MVQADYLTADDAEIREVADWMYGEWGFQNPNASHAKFAEKLRLRANKSEVPFSLVAKVDELRVGAASVIISELPQFPQYSPWLAGVFVPPKWRSRGIANLLCKKADEIVRQLGYQEYFLFTYATEPYYLLRGWERIAEANNLGTNSVIMRKKL